MIERDRDREADGEREREREAKGEAYSVTSQKLVCVSVHVLKGDVSVLERVAGRREGRERSGDVL